MRALIISTSDIHGGAAIAAYRLMHALNANGVPAEMLVCNKQSDNPLVHQVGNKTQNRLNFYRERARIFATNRFSKKNLFDVSIANSGFSITKLPQFKEADIIHLHWINQGMLSLSEIGKILAAGKKVVWTMHDMWPFTGICHHAGTCTNFQHSCGNCPYLKRASDNDLSNKIFLQKQQIYDKGKITFVACSNWLKDLALKSPLTQNGKVVSISNPIDTEIYFPQNKFEIREQLNLPADKKIILFAAAKASDKRKGVDYLIEASKLLSHKKEELLFLIVGSQGEAIAAELAVPSRALGYIPSEKMPEWYNAADLFVTPSLQENLPNTIMEAMACGTPCVGFNIGGIPEMIDHGKSGYVAEYKNAEDLANGLSWTLFEADFRLLSENARKKVMSEYAQQKIVNRYLKVYEERLQ